MTKVVDNKRNHHAEKVLQKLSKKAGQSSAAHPDTYTEGEETENTNESSEITLREQYDIIREDLLKLREDLNKGYDLAKKYMEPKILVQQILKMREMRSAESN